MGIAVKEFIEVFPARLQAVIDQHFAHERAVRAAGEMNSLGTGWMAERLLEDRAKRAHARAAGADQGAVNIEKNEPKHRANGRSVVGGWQWRKA
jgi:vancomycin permeability regulator SanA